MQRTIELTWQGEQVTVETNMKNAFRIESRLKSQGTNLMRMSMDLQTMSVAYTDGIALIAECLRCGGLKVTDEQVWDGLFGDGEVDEQGFFGVLSDLLAAFMPKPKKKPAAPKKAASRKPSTRSRKSTK